MIDMATATKPAPRATTPPPTKPGTAVVSKGPSAVAVSNAGDFSTMAGKGFEKAGRDDYAIPFLIILQSGSPQCKRSDGAYIEGATEGMLLNSVTKQVMDPVKENVIIVPCAYDRAFIEWKTREVGGGFVTQHSVEAGERLRSETERDEKGRDILGNGNQLNDTRSFYVMVIDAEGNPTPAFITMSSTQIKKAKQWLMQQNLLKLKNAQGVPYTPPMFAAKWKVSTVAEANDKGSWFGWAFEFLEFFPSTSDPIFQAVLAFHQSVTKGEVKVDMSKADAAERSGDTIDAETGEVVGKGKGKGDNNGGGDY